MLKNIRSLFIMKKAFILLCNKRKLNLVKYNKSLQDKLNLDFKDYRIYSERYIKYLESDIYKEYKYLNVLIYKGGYFKGKRNGVGKEYNSSGNLIFDGKYLKMEKDMDMQKNIMKMVH